MRLPVERASEAGAHGTEARHPATATGTPSSDPARYTLSAVRRTLAERARSRLDAAVGDLAARVHDPGDHETLDETDLGEVIELSPIVITATPPRSPEPATAPMPSTTTPIGPPRSRPAFSGDDAIIDDKNADEDPRATLERRLAELRTQVVDRHDLRVPDTWILIESVLELLGIAVGEAAAGGAGAGAAQDEVDKDTTPRVDRDAQAGKQPQAPAGGGSTGSGPARPDQAIAAADVRKMTEENQAYEQRMKRGPVALKPKAKPTLTPKDLTLPPGPGKPTRSPGPEVKGPGGIQIEQATGGESSGGGAVAAWKGKIDAKTGAVAAKAVDPAPDQNRYVVTIHEASVKQEPQSKQKKLELLADARESTEPIKDYLPSGLDLPNDPMGAARKKVDDLTNKRIQEQKPPALVKSPIDSWPVLGQVIGKADEAGNVPVYKKIKAGAYGRIHVLGPGDKEPRLGPYDEKRNEKPLAADKGPIKDRIKAHNAKLPRNVKPPAAQRNLGGTDRLNEDLPLSAPKVPSIEGVKKVDPAKVLEAALAGASAGSTRILAATVAAFPGGEGLPKGYLDPWHPDVHADVLKEIDTIRTNGKISSKLLDEKLGAERTKVEQEVEASHQTMQVEKSNAVTEYRTTKEHIGDFISGVKDELDREAEEQAILAKGGYDSAEIKNLVATRDRYVKQNDDKVELWIERYKAQRDSRKKKLDDFEQEQVMAYKACAELDRQTIRKRAPAGWEKDAAKKQEVTDACQEITDWETLIISTGKLKDGTEGVKTVFDKLRGDMHTQVNGWDRALKKAGGEYQDAAEAWYKKQLGLEQGILDKIVNAVLEFLGVAKKKHREWKRRSDADNTTYLKTGQNDLAQLQVDHEKKLNQDQLDATKGLSESQRAIAQSFFIDKEGDGAAALAAGLMAQLGEQWRPRLFQRVEAKLLAGSGADLVAVADKMPGPTTMEVVNRLKKSFEGMGTKDKDGLIYDNLAGLSRIQMKAVEYLYEQEVGSSLRGDMDSELHDVGEMLFGSAHDFQRGDALLQNARSVAETSSVNQALIEAEVIALNQAMDAAFLGTGAGTEEADLLKHLRGKSPAEIDALKAAYKERYGKDLVAHVKDELLDGVSARYQWDEALALLENRPEDAEAAALRSSMGHVKVGGKKSHVFLGAATSFLGGPVLGPLSGVLGGGVASLGDKLGLPLDDDAILNRITREPKEADDALTRVRKQLDQEATAGGWSDKLYRQQLALRYQKIDDVFGTKYAGGVGAMSMTKSPLEQAFANSFSNDTAKMLTGILRQDLAMEAAGRVGAEIMPVPGRSEGINKALFDQYQRQYEGERRDVELEFREKKEKKRQECTVFLVDKTGKVVLDEYGNKKVDKVATRTKTQAWAREWMSPEGADARRVEADAEAERRAKAKAPGNMDKLVNFYNDPKNGFTSALWSKGDFHADVFSATNVSWAGVKDLFGYEDRTSATDKTLMLLEQGGYLSGGQQLFYAVYGVGTDEEAVNKAYDGKSKAQVDRMHSQLGTAMAGAGVKTAMSPAEWVKDDFSGRELDDIDEKQYGVPVTIDDRIARAERQLTREQKSRESGAGAGDRILGGVVGTIFLGPIAGPLVGGGLVGYLGDLRKGMAAKEMATFEGEVAKLKALKGDIAKKQAELAKKDIVEGDPEFYEAMAPLYERAAVMTRSVDAALDAHRNKIDAIADWVTAGIQAIMIVGAVVIGAVVSIVTAGAATPAAVAAISALITAVVTSAATIGAKIIIKGGAYGWEELAGDAAMAVVEAVLAAATANISTGLLKSGTLLGKLASKGAVAKFIAEGLAGVVEGVVQGIPSAIFGAAIQENFTLDNILGQIGNAAGMAGAMHLAKPALNPVLGRLGNAITKRFGPRPTQEILSYRGSPAHLEETFKAYQQEKPGATKQQFLRELDEVMIGRHHNAFGDPSTQHVLRNELLDGIPAQHRQKYASAHVEMMSDVEFSKKFGSADDAHVLVRDGKPVVVVRAGTDLATVGAKSPHVFEAAVATKPKTAGPDAPAVKPKPAAVEADLPAGKAHELPPQKVIMEPYAGPSIDSALDIARKNPGAKVIATESSYRPTDADVKTLERGGHEFHGDNKPAAVPHNSVDEVKMRFPLSEREAARVTFMGHLARVQAEHPHLPPAKQHELAMGRVETVGTHAPYALERLKPGGQLEVVFWEKHIGGEIGKLQDLTYTDPKTGKTYRFEVVSTEMIPKSQIAPHSGFGVPLTGPHEPVHVTRLRKVEVELEAGATKKATPESEPHGKRPPPTPEATEPPARRQPKPAEVDIETEMAESRRPGAPVEGDGPSRVQRVRSEEAPLGTRAEAAAQAEKGRCAAWIWVEVMRNIGWTGAVADQPGWHPSVDAKPTKGQPRRGFGDIVRAIRDPSTGNKLPRIEGHPSELIAQAQGMKPGTQIVISAKTKNGVWHAMLGVVLPDGSLELTHVGRASEVRGRVAVTPDPAGNVMVTTRIYDAQVPELANFKNHRWWVLPDMKGPGILPKIQTDAPSVARMLPEGERLPSRVRKSLETDLADAGRSPSKIRELDDNALLAAHAKAQPELTPKRIAEFRETLPMHARGALDSLAGETHLHHQPINDNIKTRLTDALGTPVHLDPTLAPGEIQVKYKVGTLGNVVGLELHVGPGATLGDALHHVGTLHSFKRYQGVTGVLRNLNDSIGRLFGSGKLALGTKAHDAWKELQKLPAIVESRKLRLADTNLDIHTRTRLEIEIESLERQIAKHVGELGDLKAKGRGYVASEGARPRRLEDPQFRHDLKQQLAETKGQQTEILATKAVTDARAAIKQLRSGLPAPEGVDAPQQRAADAAGVLGYGRAAGEAPLTAKAGHTSLEVVPAGTRIYTQEKAKTNIVVTPADTYLEIVQHLPALARAAGLPPDVVGHLIELFHGKLPFGVELEGPLVKGYKPGDWTAAGVDPTTGRLPPKADPEHFASLASKSEKNAYGRTLRDQQEIVKAYLKALAHTEVISLVSEPNRISTHLVDLYVALVKRGGTHDLSWLAQTPAAMPAKISKAKAAKIAPHLTADQIGVPGPTETFRKLEAILEGGPLPPRGSKDDIALTEMLRRYDVLYGRHGGVSINDLTRFYFDRHIHNFDPADYGRLYRRP